MRRILSVLCALATVLVTAGTMAMPVAAQNSVIEVPGDFPTIQQAIDAASDDDIIVVAAGLYSENVVIDKSLTLKGAQAGVDARGRSGDETIIQPDDPQEATGIHIVSAAGRVVLLDGLTVQNARHGITLPDPFMAEHITIKNVRALNCLRFGITAAHTLEATIENCYVENAEYGINAGALTPFLPTVATLSNNEIVNAEFGISGYLTDSVIEANVVRDYADGGVGISGQFLNTEVRNNTVTNYTDGAAMTFEWHYGRYLSENVNVEGNTFTGNNLGVYVFDTQTEMIGITINFNNIAGNSWYGVRNDSSETLDATRNWWGHVSGPGRTGPGSGDDVSSRVIYSPWLGAETGTEPMTWVVDTTSSIQEAIDGAAQGDSVMVTKGNYEEELAIGRSLAVRSLHGAEETTVTGSVSIGLNAGTVIFGGEEAGFTIDAKGGDFAIWLSADNGSEVTISENTLTGALDGISTRNGSLNDSSISIDENRIYKNEYGIYIESITGDSSVSINFNGLAQNDEYGLYVQSSSVTVDGTDNWWGHRSGPSGGVADPVSGRVADGEGSAVSAHVRFDPWITAYLHSLTIECTRGGSVTEPGEGEFIYEAGTEVELRVYPNPFYRFQGWTGDVGTIANAQAPETTITIQGDYLITASFTSLLPCFIATAAYGSETAEEIGILREFRDTVLARNALGSGLVSLYYRASPPAAGLVSRNEVLRTIVRVGLLDPIVKVLSRTHPAWSSGVS